MNRERAVRVLFFASLALWLAAWLWSEALPAPQAVHEELLSEPIQQARDDTPISTRAGGVEYGIYPRFTYDLHGLVVSRHDSAVWWDYIHKEVNDNLNVVDLCVVWGNNIRRDAYRALDYSNDQWTCWFQAESMAAYTAFDAAAISNNHMITDKADIAKALRSVRVGDQIHFKGYLADYCIYKNASPGPKRVSSSVRNDSGNGACEIVYVESLDILQSGGGAWRILKPIAELLVGLSVLAWFLLPPRIYR